MKNDIKCSECGRCVWDPVGGGYIMCCYGNGFELRVHKSMKDTFMVKDCKIARKKFDTVSTSDEMMELAHKQYAGLPKRQSKLDMF